MRNRKLIMRSRIKQKSLTQVETIESIDSVVVRKRPGKGRLLGEDVQENVIENAVEQLSLGNSVSFDMNVDGGILHVKGDIGGYMDTFVNIVENDFKSIISHEEMILTAITDLVRREGYGRTSVPRQMALRRKKGKKVYMNAIVYPEFQKNLDEGRYGDQEEIISKIYLIANKPETYLQYKSLEGYLKGSYKMDFTEELGYYKIYGALVKIVSGIRGPVGWEEAINNMEFLWEDMREIYQAGGRKRPLEADEDEEYEEEATGPEFKRPRMSAPVTSSKSYDLYRYLALYLEPSHDFLGSRTSTKLDKQSGSIKDYMSNTYFKKNVLKTISDVNFKEKLTNGVTNPFREEPSGYGYNGLSELRNLLEIMSYINAKEKCISLSFKDSSFTPKSGEAYSLGEKISSGVEKMLEFLVKNFFDGISRIYRDAGGTDFVRLVQKDTKKIDHLQADKPFAEKMLDGAGPKSIESSELSDKIIYVDYEEEVLKITKDYVGITNLRDYIVENDPEADQIQIRPYPLKSGVIPKTDGKKNILERLFRINLGNIGDRGKDLIVSFDPSVHDLSIFIKYYMKLLENKSLDKKLSKKYNDVIWVLLSIKRMGDHGQAERAKISSGLFESGDHLASAYGMIIDTPTLFRYTTELSVYKTSSRVFQIIKTIQRSAEIIRDFIPKADVFGKISREVSLKYQYYDDKKVSDIPDKEFLLDSMTVLSSISKLLGFIFDKSPTKKTPQKVVSDTFGKVRTTYESYKKKAMSGNRLEPSTVELASSFLFFFMKKDTINKVLSGFDILVRVLVEITKVAGSENFKEYKDIIVDIVKENISRYTTLDIYDLKDALRIILDKVKLVISEAILSKNVFVRIVRSALNDLETDIETIMEQIDSLNNVITQLS